MNDHIQKEKGGANPLPNYRISNSIILENPPQADNWQFLGDLVSDVVKDSFNNFMKNTGSTPYAR